jgi:hypothetical protein
MVLFPGIPMEIYIISDGKVVPYLQHPEFDKSIPVIPPKVDTVNLTWEAGHETVCISSLHVCRSPNFLACNGLIYYLIFKRYPRPSATTSVSRRLNKLCIMFKNIAFLITTLFVRLYLRISILIKCKTHLHHFTERGCLGP